MDMALQKLHLWTSVMQQTIQNAELKICFMVPVVTAVPGFKIQICPKCSIVPWTYNMAQITAALKFLL
jgi:hypothetical protein